MFGSTNGCQYAFSTTNTIQMKHQTVIKNQHFQNVMKTIMTGYSLTVYTDVNDYFLGELLPLISFLHLFHWFGFFAG